MNELQIIHAFANWLTLFHAKGELKKTISSGQLWQLVGKAERIDWDLKRSLQRLAYLAATANLDYEVAIKELNELAEKYEKKEVAK